MPGRPQPSKTIPIMNTKHLFKLGVLTITAWLMAGWTPAGAQEEELKMALEMQDRRIAGLTKLADQIKNFGFLKIGQGVMKKLEDRSEKEDPFGMAMDPEDELPEIEAAAEGLEEGEEQALRTSLQEALTKLNITGVFPARKLVMIGAQELGVGDEIVIEFKETVFNLKILKITNTELGLKDSETQEEATLAIGFSGDLPQGMSRKQPTATAEDTTREESTIVPMSKRVVKVSE